MIVDGQADFRSLLMHHVTTHWPEAVITSYDPTAAGYLPDEFSGAGNDAILFGDRYGDRDALEALKRFTRSTGFPPLIFFGRKDDEQAALKAGADAFFPRDDIRHGALTVRLSDLLKSRRRTATTGSLFVGDEKTGILPLIRGYRLIRRLTRTSHSGIYLAEREATGDKVVLKVLRQVPDFADSIGAFDRFLQEYELIAEINHPNIVRIYDLGVGDDHAHIAMEYLNGGDLRQRITRGVRAADAVRYVKQIASALAKIHEVGVLHRDLKPGNIMLRADDSIALIDFGLARRMRLEMELTDEGEIFGTPYYMSPEQGHANDVDHRSDIYSLGIIFYELLTGEKPYRADTAMGIIYLHAQAPIPLLSARFSRYQAALNMMLAKHPDDRLQSADEIVEWL